MLKPAPVPHEAANDAVRCSAGSEDQPPSTRGGRGGRKHRGRKGPNPLGVGCPVCKREKGRHCLGWEITKTFHSARVQLASRVKTLDPKKPGDTKRVLRRLQDPTRYTAPAVYLEQ